jgi:AcrR family transcriptional regulator
VVSAGAVESSPVRPPVQARSRRTLARILDASLTLLGERGWDGLTVQDIVSRAGTSVGSFYARFSGKKDLLSYVEESVWTRARERWDEQLSARIGQGDLLRERIRTVVELLLEAQENESVKRLSPVWGDAGGGSEFGCHLRDTTAAMLLERRTEIRHPDPLAAIWLGHAAVTGAVRERPEGWEDGPLAEELARLWLCYLGQRESDYRGNAGAVDFFQVWT